MAKSRVFIDIGEMFNLHLTVEAIDAGVPQVNRKVNPFCAHKKNGFFIENISEIEDALDHFLIGLQNWNESLLYMAQLKDHYTDKQIMARWESFKEGIVHEDSAN